MRYRLRAVTRRRSPLALSAALLLLAAACSSAPTVPDHPTDAAQLIAGIAVITRADTPSQRLMAYPTASLFGDGRLIRPGPQIELFPGPALPSLVITQIDTAGIEAVLLAAAAAGLTGADQEMRFPIVANPPTTIFVVFADGTRHQTVVEALGLEKPDDGRLPPTARAQRDAMKALVAMLQEPRVGALAANVEGDDTAYEPTGMRVLVSPAEPGAEPSPVPPATRDWPLATDLANVGEVVEGDDEVRCGIVEGADFAALYPLVKESNELTRWASSGVEYTVRFRPLLPGESGCGG